jgi:hypothetical protein
MLRTLLKSIKGGAGPSGVPDSLAVAEVREEQGVVLQPAPGSAQAIALAQAYLQRHPDLYEARFDLAQHLVAAARHAEAEALLRELLRLRPAGQAALHLLGFALKAQGRLEEAIEYGRLAVAVEPFNGLSQVLLAQQLFLAGRFGEAFLHFRARCPKPPEWTRTLPLWEGEPLAGRRLLVWLDWGGIGDELMFARYVPMLLRDYAPGELHWSVLAPNRHLLSLLPGVTQVFSQTTGLAVDCHIPLLDLPCLFGTNEHNVPAVPAYLRADADDSARWARRVGDLPGLKVGLCWSSGHWKDDPEFERDRKARSAPLALLAELARIEGVSAISLQKGRDAAEWAALPGGTRIHDFEAELTDMAQTAALIENLDLVISVDTSVAHLAAALGKPVLLLAAWNIGLFWGAGERTPWYPSMRLLRQRTAGDWRGETARACGLLRDWARNSQVDLFAA